MNVWAAAVVLATHQGAPPPDLEAVAATLGRSGAKVMVGRAELGDGWEIWYDESRRVDDQAFAPLQNIKKLGAIRFLGGGFGDEGVAKLKSLPDLHLLVLFSDRLTDRCLEPIAKLKALVKLDLGYAKLSYKGLARLVQLPRLQRLYLYNAIFDDRAAQELKQLKKLRILDLPSTLRAATVSSLQKDLPNTRVIQRKPS